MTPAATTLARRIARLVLRHDEDTALWILGFIVGVLRFRLGHEKVEKFLEDFQGKLSDNVERRERRIAAQGAEADAVIH